MVHDKSDLIGKFTVLVVKRSGMASLKSANVFATYELAILHAGIQAH